MNIAITSPEKFRFQDLVCIELIFRFLENSGAQFYPEHKGGEDGLLLIPSPDGNIQLELQVKGSLAEVDLESIAHCLIHYPPREHKNSLLERVYNDPNRYALLVFSGRCNDSAAAYVVDPQWTGQIHSEKCITPAIVEQFRETYRAATPEGAPEKKLYKKRKDNAELFIDAATDEKLTSALRRVAVIELSRTKDVVAICESKMQGTPLDRRKDILNRLKDHINFSKTQAIDAFPEIRAILRESQRGSHRPENYALRGHEAQWHEELSRTRALLLSGRTRVGKSEAAKWILSEFASLGYETRIVFEAQAAERFLQEPGAAPRLALLDDPLNFDITAASSALSLIDKLIRRLLPNQAIIIAQGQEALLDITGKTALNELTTGGKTWIDLSELSRKFLNEVWQSQSQGMSVPSKIVDEVSKALLSEELALEPGSLTHLAAQHDRLPSRPTLVDYEKLAREDSALFGQWLHSTHCDSVLLALVVSTSSTDTADLDSIAFILGSGGDKLPARETIFTFSMSHKEAITTHELSLSYESPPCLQTEHEERLEYLETHRIINISSNNISFSHPFYRAAGTHSITPKSFAGRKRLIDAINRALFCNSSKASKSAARNLGSFYSSLNSHPEGNKLLLLAASAINECRFIATRDLCFAFLIQQHEHLPAELKEQLPSWIIKVNIGLSDIVWVKGECLSFEGAIDFSAAFSEYDIVKTSQISATLTELRQGLLPLPQDLALLVKYFEQNPASMQIEDVKAFLGYDEAVLRSAACSAWISEQRMNDTEFWVLIEKDNHPSIARAVLNGALEGWAQFDQERRTLILEKLAIICTHPAGAAAIIPELVTFGREEYTGPAAETPWEIFTATFPNTMRALPDAAVFSDARLFHAISLAIQHISIECSLTIIDAMISWAISSATKGCVLSDFQASFAELLITATSTNPEARKDRLPALLKFPGTAGIIRIAADIIDNWDRLVDVEKNATLDLLKSKREDEYWIKAAAITRPKIPFEIKRAILSQTEDLDTVEAALRLPEKLLNAAVHIYSGRPQPLWWIGTHHSGNSLWSEVIENIALNGSHPLFHLAWIELLFSPDETALCRIISEIDTSLIDRIFEILISLKASTNQEYIKAPWLTLLRRRNTDNIPAEWQKKISDCLPAIIEDIWELPKWLEQPYLTAALKMVRTDREIIETIDRINDLNSSIQSEKLLESAVKIIPILLEQSPPRLYGTCDFLTRNLRRWNIEPEDLSAQISALREDILTKRTDIKKQHSFRAPSLENWIEP